jgi:hypothetical protein
MIRLNDLSDASTKPPSYRSAAWNAIQVKKLRLILEKELGLMLKESENVLDFFRIVLSVMISCPPRCPPRHKGKIAAGVQLFSKRWAEMEQVQKSVR